MSLAADLEALRTGVTLMTASHLSTVRVGGRDAHDLLDRVSPRPLFARQGQMIHTLLLAEDATPLGDVYICCDEDDFILITDGMSGSAVVDFLQPHVRDLAVTLTDISATHALLSINGPYAWELVAHVTSPDVIGLNYLSFYVTGRFTCVRAGKTGEFGYDLLVARDEVDAVRNELIAAGAKMDVRQISLEAHDLAQLEAGFFNVRREVRPGLSPVELQLQWRASSDRTYPGSAAYLAKRKSAKQRVTLAVSADPIATDAAITYDGRTVGTILHAGPSFTRGGHIAVALLDSELSYPGIDAFTVGSSKLRTISSPATNNRSIYIDPQRHTWATQGSTAFPPLVRPAWS